MQEAEAETQEKKQLKLLIFGGTVEGRQVSDYLLERQVAHTVCVATEYGAETAESAHAFEDRALRTVHQGRMDAEQMRTFLREGRYALVVDATHPYAVEVSKNIREACERETMPYIRYLRPQGDGKAASGTDASEKQAGACTPASPEGQESQAGASALPNPAEGQTEPHSVWSKAVSVGSAKEAADYLEKQQGRIFLTTGSKELHVFTGTISDKSRLFARVLPSAEVVALCRSLGLEGKQICAMQGPFSTEINQAMIRQTGASFLVTKETGVSGGFPEKMEAARQCGITPVVIRRPEETGSDWAEVKARLDRLIAGKAPSAEQPEAPIPEKSSEAEQPLKIRKDLAITCVGIGMGTPDTLTQEALDEIRNAQVLFGAKRILESARNALAGGAPSEGAERAEDRSAMGEMIPEYSAEKIYAWLAVHPEFTRAAILMSGDVGFYSGARRVAETFPADQVRYVCGISSVVYFASRIPTSWQDAKLLSAHGKELALLNYVKKYPKIILLVSGASDVERFCRELADAGLAQVRVTVGTNLSYPEETIRAGAPGEFLSLETTGLHIMMVENPHAGEVITPGIPDEAFVRGKVPMTKEEIRALSVAKLRLREDSIVYDVGAGTGSVSVECARLCTEGKVYAIERNPEGIALIRENGRKFAVSNLVAVEGIAPEALSSLPAPTHAFIGGSSGNMREIVETLRGKNPAVRIVINTVTMETIAEVMDLLRGLNIEDADIVQVSAAKSRPLGHYHMMTAHNPVYIISFGDGKEA